MTPDFIFTDSNMVDVVIQKGEILNRFRFLLPVKTLHTEVGTCIPCLKSQKGEQLREAIKAAQRHIALMSAEDKQAMKAILKIKNARVFYVRPVNGNMVRERVDF